MTKILNAIIITVMIALIAVFIVSAISLQSKTDKVLTQYSAKREELAAKQQQIQDLIVSLNSTLSAEAVKQQQIATQLGITINTTTIAPLTTISTTPAASNPVITRPQNTVTTIPSTTTTSRPVRTTRAS